MVAQMQRFFSSKGYIYVLCHCFCIVVLCKHKWVYVSLYSFLKKGSQHLFLFFFQLVFPRDFKFKFRKKSLAYFFFTIASSSCTHTKLFFSDTVRITSSGFQLLHEHIGLIMSPKGLFPASSLSTKHTSSVFCFINFWIA